MSRTKQAAIDLANESGNLDVPPGADNAGPSSALANLLDEIEGSFGYDDLPNDTFDGPDEAAF